MRLYHDCWRHILGRWKEKTQHARKVVFAGEVCHQTRSFIGGLLGDQQVVLHVLLICVMSVTCIIRVLCIILVKCIICVICIICVLCIIRFFVSGEGSNDSRGLSRMPPMLRLTRRVPFRWEKKYQNHGFSAQENNNSCLWG